MTEEEKVLAVALNLYLNGFSSEKYDWRFEAEAWAKSSSYFPELTYYQFLEIARKYDFWVELEKCVPIGL